MPRRRNHSGFGLLQTAVLGTLLLLSSGGAVLGTLAWSGLLKEEAPSGPSREGKVAVIRSIRPLSAYTKVRREDVYDLAAGDESYYWLDKALVERNPDWLITVDQVVGRVMAREKEAGYTFTEKDFLPKGSRTGVVGGIPEGKRAVTISTERVTGLDQFRQGDRFDLFVSLPFREDLESRPNVEYGVMLGGLRPPDQRATRLDRQSGVKLLAENAAMVALLHGSNLSTQGLGGLPAEAAGQSARSSRKQPVEAMVAVDPAELMPLLEAIGGESPVFCIARSGRPGESKEDALSSLLEGMVAVPAAVRSISACEQITQSDLADPVTGKVNVYYFPAERVDENWIDDVSRLIGRVVSRDIEPGYLFKEADLYPAGTPPGLAAAVPEGMVALALPERRIDGLHTIRRGDRFDVLSTLPEGLRPSNAPVDWATLQGGTPPPEDAELHRQLQTGLRTVARGAVRLNGSANGGEQIVIAVTPEDAQQISQAVQLNVELQVLAQPAECRAAPAASRPPLNRGASRREQTGFVSADAQPADVRDEPADDRLTFPVITRPVRAFQKLRAEDFVDEATGRPRLMSFPAEAVRDDWQSDLPALIGRVTARDIEPGYVIRQRDLLPPESRHGAAGGVPPGRVAFTASSRQISGLEQLHSGDRVVIVASRPLDVQGSGMNVRWSAVSASAGGLLQQADVRVVCRDVLLVAVSESREATIRQRTRREEVQNQYQMTPSGLVRTETRRTEPVTETFTATVRDYVLAIDPADSARLSEAVSTDVLLFALARSGNSQDDPRSPAIPKQQPLADSLVIEHLRGSSRERELWLIDGDRRAAVSNVPRNRQPAQQFGR